MEWIGLDGWMNLLFFCSVYDSQNCERRKWEGKAIGLLQNANLPFPPPHCRHCLTFPFKIATHISQFSIFYYQFIYFRCF